MLHEEIEKTILMDYSDNYKEYLYNLLHDGDRPVVYEYRNLNDDIVYIGSCINLRNRIEQRLTKSKIYFDRIYRKNPEKFKIYIIKECSSLDEARELEKKMIWKFLPEYNVAHKQNFIDIIEILYNNEKCLLRKKLIGLLIQDVKQLNKNKAIG